MIRPRLLLPLLLAALLGLAACGSGDGAAGADGSGGIAIVEPTVDRPANPDLAAVRLQVRNDGDEADELVGVSTDVARSSMVHRSETDAEGRSTMAMVSDLEIPARSTVTFEPGGLHIMLQGLDRELEVGDEVEVTLVFRDAGSITATAPVVEPGAAAAESAPDDEEASHGH